jgi:hypothetical protein
MEEKRRYRWFSFRLRTLLIAVVLLSLPLGWAGYMLAWIRERDRRLSGWSRYDYGRRYDASHLDWWVESNDMSSGGFRSQFHEMPLTLRMFGADHHYQVHFFGDRERVQDTKALFPEAMMVVNGQVK